MKKQYLYKIIFPECNKLYFGRTNNEHRYGKTNTFGERFYGPHHNKDVQKLLNQGEVAFMIVVYTYCGEDSLVEQEGKYLKKVWKSGNWQDRPEWLLNRNVNPVGFSSGESHPNKSEGAKKRTSARIVGNNYGSKHKGRKNTWMEGDKNHMRQPIHRDRAKKEVSKLHTPEIRKKALESLIRTLRDPSYVNPNIGRKRPDLAEKNRTDEVKRKKAKDRMTSVNKTGYPCPECNLEFNLGNLSKHLRIKHGWESGLPETVKQRLKEGGSGLPE